MCHSYDAVVVNDLYRVVRGPAFPLPGEWIACLEHEASVPRKCRPYCGQRLSQLVVIDEHLKRMTSHYDEIELSTPVDRS